MNRNNFWIHVLIAVVLISLAGVVGKIARWQSTPASQIDTVTSKPNAPKRSFGESEPEINVRFRPGVTLDEIKKIAAKNNDRIEDEIESVKGLVSIDDLDNADAETLAEQYSQMTDLVVYAEPNFEIRLDPTQIASPSDLPQSTNAQSIDEQTIDPIPPSIDPKLLNLKVYRKSERDKVLPNDPRFNEQWALSNDGQNGGKANADVAALKAWLKTQGSDKVVVAVLDTGVDYTHPDLVENMWFRPENVPQYNDDELGTFNDERGFNAERNQSDPMDENGHGTHCAGIIGAEGNNEQGIAGINWEVKIMPLKFLGRGGYGTTKDAIEAINYAIDRKRNGVNIKVISASWGSPARSKALEDTIRAAGEEGILFVAAAGNNGANNDKSPHYPSNYALPNVISVAALDRSDTLASFSNFGVKTVHIAAPGKEILSTWLNDQYREASGTSMATPYVSGVAALILASEPNLSVEKLRERLLRSVDKINSLDGQIESGGRINAAKALGN